MELYTYRFFSENGLSAELSGETAEYKLKGENYVRVEVLAEHGAMLFTQPVYRKDLFRKP